MVLREYDALVSAIYEAGAGSGTIADMFERMWRSLEADSAGVSIYDDADQVITHTLVSASRSLPRGFTAKVLPLNEQPGVKLVTVTRLPVPRRFTDIVPEKRLRNMEWYRRQAELSGMGHGIMIDVAISGVRVRLFAVRQHGADNFSQDDLEHIGMLGGHLRRAFAASLWRLSPAQTSRKLQLIVYSEDRLAGVFCDASLDRELALRFGLSPAERRVLKVMLGGLTRAKAAEELQIGVNSLKTHMRRIYAKTGARRLPDIMMMARRLEDPARRSLIAPG